MPVPRAKNDYSLYRTRDVIVMEDYYYVMSGDMRKTDRPNPRGQYVGRGPFIVPGRDRVERMRTILGGRQGVSDYDKRGIAVAERLFLRPAKSASATASSTYWRSEALITGS